MKTDAYEFIQRMFHLNLSLSVPTRSGTVNFPRLLTSIPQFYSDWCIFPRYAKTKLEKSSRIISPKREKQLEQIEKLAANRKKPNEIELQIMLEHAYHHLNFAWNIRHVATENYANLSNEEFNKWGKYPKEMTDAE